MSWEEGAAKADRLSIDGDSVARQHRLFQTQFCCDTDKGLIATGGLGRMDEVGDQISRLKSFYLTLVPILL
jgi:hypothetical protein